MGQYVTDDNFKNIWFLFAARTLESLVEKWSTNLTSFSFLPFAIPGYSGLYSIHSY